MCICIYIYMYMYIYIICIYIYICLYHQPVDDECQAPGRSLGLALRGSSMDQLVRRRSGNPREKPWKSLKTHGEMV